jgi:hypothetical protein
MSEEPDLAVNAETLSPVEDAARGLYEELPAKGLAAEPESLTSGERLGQAGLASGPALLTLTERWHTKILDLQNDCAAISGHLNTTVATHQSLELQIQDGLRAAEAPTREDGADQALLALFGVEPDPAGDA